MILLFFIDAKTSLKNDDDSDDVDLTTYLTGK